MELTRRLRMPGRGRMRDVVALYFAARHPDTPWYVKALLASAVVYLVSPVDLLPDLAPILGYADDLAVVPLLLMLAMSLVPEPVKEASRARAAAAPAGARSTRALGAMVAVAALVITAALVVALVRAVAA